MMGSDLGDDVIFVDEHVLVGPSRRRILHRGRFGIAEVAEKFAFQIDAKIIHGAVLRRLGGKPHDPGQFRERIALPEVDQGFGFELLQVCHAFSRTHTLSERRGVANFFAGTSVMWANGVRQFRPSAHLLGRIRAQQSQARPKNIQNRLHQPKSGSGQYWIVNLKKA